MTDFSMRRTRIIVFSRNGKLITIDFYFGPTRRFRLGGIRKIPCVVTCIQSSRNLVTGRSVHNVNYTLRVNGIFDSVIYFGRIGCRHLIAVYRIRPRNAMVMSL